MRSREGEPITVGRVAGEGVAGGSVGCRGKSPCFGVIRTGLQLSLSLVLQLVFLFGFSHE